MESKKEPDHFLKKILDEKFKEKVFLFSLEKRPGNFFC